MKPAQQNPSIQLRKTIDCVVINVPLICSTAEDGWPAHHHGKVAPLGKFTKQVIEVCHDVTSFGRKKNDLLDLLSVTFRS